MWSHTIQSSASKSTNPAERPAQAGKNLKKKDEAVTAPEEDMTKGFDTDGFSKTSKVHAYKKPLTVAKAPSFSRTTSRTGQTAAGGTDPLRKDSQNKTTQPVKSTQTSKTGTPARVPRTATLTLSSSRATKAGTPSKNNPPVTSPKHSVSGRSLNNTSTQHDLPSQTLENPALGSETHESDKLGESPSKDSSSKHERDLNDMSVAEDLLDHQTSEGLEHKINIKDGEIRDLQTEIRRMQTTKDADIDGLKAQIEDTKTTSGHKFEETNNAFLAQKTSLESELSEARKKIADLEASHHKTQEEHNKVLSSKDEEIQRLSQAAQERRREHEAKDSAQSLKGEFERLQNQHKRERDEALEKTFVELEKIKVERDELSRSRDKEVKKMGDLVQELQEKVEKAHQTEKDEIKEAKRGHEQELHDKVEEHERELQDAAIKHEKALRDSALQYEQNLRDADTKHLQEMNDSQRVLRDTTQRHDQESRATASKHQQEMEDLMLKHQEEIQTNRTRSEQASEDSAAKHQQEIGVLIAKHKGELEAAAAGQEQVLRDAAAKYHQEYQSLETKHLEELRAATNRDEQDSEALSAKHQEELEAMTAKHQDELKNNMTTNEQILRDQATQGQQAVDAMLAKHREELANAASQIEELRTVTQKYQQDLGNSATTHKEDLKHMTLRHQQDLREVKTRYGQELEEAKTKHEELESESLEKEYNIREAAQKHQEEAVLLQNQLETATGNVALLESTLKDLELQKENFGKEADLKHKQDFQSAALKYEEELQSLRTIYATAVEEITILKRTLEDVEQKQREAVEEELQSLRIVYATAVEEISALRRKVEDLNQKRSEAADEIASLKASLDDHDLKRSEAVNQLTSLLATAKDEELEQSEAAVEIALLRDKLELADRRFEQDQQAVSDLQRQTQDLQAQVTKLSKDKDLDQTEAAVDAALFKDKLELADLEIHLHKGTISALQNEIETLKTRLAEEAVDKELDHDEAVVDVALLQDKLELANIQIRQAKGTVNNLQEEIESLKVQITNSAVGMDSDQNEAAVEIALLKNTLELANLESHQDKATLTTLRKQIESLQAQSADNPKTGSYTHHQLRDELSMLDRHHAAQMTDIDSLLADMAAERELREQGWKQRADVWDRFADELQGMKTQVMGTVGGNS